MDGLMDGMSLRLIERIGVALLIGIAGYVIQKRGVLSEAGREGIVKLVMSATFPCLAFTSMVTQVDPSALGHNLLIASMGFLMFCMGGLLGLLALLPVKLEGKRKGTFLHLMVANNYIYLPVTLVNWLWPGEMATLCLNMIGGGVAFWSIAIYPLVHHMPLKERLRHVFNLPFISLVAGLAAAMLHARGFFYSPDMKWALPFARAGLDAAKLLGNTTAPLALVVVGSILASSTSRAGWKLMLYYSSLRLIVFPIIFLPVIWLSGLKGDTALVMLLLSSMPAANTSALVAERFGGDGELASSANLYSTLLCIITVPMIFYAYTHFIL